MNPSGLFSKGDNGLATNADSFSSRELVFEVKVSLFSYQF